MKDVVDIITAAYSYFCLFPQFTSLIPFLTHCLMTSLVAQTVKRLSTMWEIRVWSLGWEDPLEKEMAIHSSTIAWKIPWTEDPGRSQRVGHDRATSHSTNRFAFLLFSLNSFSVFSCLQDITQAPTNFTQVCPDSILPLTSPVPLLSLSWAFLLIL